jgi:hypothetical protein
MNRRESTDSFTPKICQHPLGVPRKKATFDSNTVTTRTIQDARLRSVISKYLFVILR